MKLIDWLAILMLCGCAFTTPAGAIEIQNFKAGLNCFANQEVDAENPKTGWICFTDNTIHITGQGECVYNGVKQRCTWYGYEFDYIDASDDEVITCTNTSSQPVDFGDPEKVISSDASTYEYSFKLKPGAGHFYNPQYSLMFVSGDAETVVEDETVCRSGDQEVLRFQFKFVYPQG